MLAAVTTSTSTVIDANEHVVNMQPLLLKNVDFKCTPQFCYGVGPIHQVLQNLQHQLSSIVPLRAIDGFIGQGTVTAAAQAANQILGLYGQLSREGTLSTYGLNIGSTPLRVLQTLASGNVTPAQITEWTVALTQLFRIGAKALAARGGY